MSNSSSGCPSVGEAKRLLVAFSVFPVIAMISNVVTILMIVRVAAHRKFGHRLILYLAIAGVIRTCSFWSQVVPVDLKQPDDSPVTVREGWYGACVFGGFFSLYTAFLESFILVWICLHIFASVIFQNRLNRPKQEVFGVLTVALVPLLFSWEPFIKKSFGLTGVTCWIKDTCQDNKLLDHLIIKFSVIVVPLLLLTLVSICLISTAIISLCRRARRGLLKHKHWLAIKEILPLTIYPSLHAIIDIGRLFVDLAGAGNERYYAVSDVVAVCLYNVAAITVPLSLVLQSGFRHDYSRRSNQRRSDSVPSSRADTEREGEDSGQFGAEEDKAASSSILASKEMPTYTSMHRSN